MTRVERRSLTICLLAIAVAACGISVRSLGLGKSLWVDEAWVANSVIAPSLEGMFYTNSYLQTSPPLFLLLVRAVVPFFGLSNPVLRIVPFAMGILAGASMFFLTRRLFLREYALLAWALFVFSPAAIDFSTKLKQYSTELAVSTTVLLVCVAYIERPTARRLWLLTATIAVGLLASYSVAFVLPGLVLIVFMTPIRNRAFSSAGGEKSARVFRALNVAAVAGGTLIAEYFLVIAPNMSAGLRAAWALKNADVHNIFRLATTEVRALFGLLPLNYFRWEGRLLFVAAAISVVFGFTLSFLRFRNGGRKWFGIQILCAIPCILLIVSDWFSWYPFLTRTSLFTLPFVVVLLVSCLQLVFLYVQRRQCRRVGPFLDAVFSCAVAVTIVTGVHTALNENRRPPWEDADAAVSFLQTQVQPKDLLWVHASCSETFRLYAEMRGWRNANAHFGKTGVPCCQRGALEMQLTTSELLVRNDFGNAIPTNFSGTVWLLYSKRPELWQILGLDESELMKTILRERGCVEGPTPSFFNIGVSTFDCRRLAVLTPGPNPR